jgi:CheY-like chemotaxis protein
MSSAISGKKETNLTMGQAQVQTQEEELVHDSRTLRILAADDSKDNQFLMKAYLESLPYRIVFADNGLIALEKFKESRFDIVLMDLQMPEMDGYSAVEAIRAWERSEGLKPIPVVAVTAHDSEYETKRFQDAGFSDYLVKPISPNQIRKAILNHTQHMSPAPEKPEATDAIATLEKRIAELAPGYLRSRKDDVKELKNLIAQSNFKQIGILGHRTKGSAKSYGFEELGKLGALLEDAADEMDWTKTQQVIASMDEFLRATN